MAPGFQTFPYISRGGEDEDAILGDLLHFLPPALQSRLPAPERLRIIRLGTNLKAVGIVGIDHEVRPCLPDLADHRRKSCNGRGNLFSELCHPFVPAWKAVNASVL